MPIEVEKKYRLNDEQMHYVLDELSKKAASFQGEDFEENTIYGGGVLDEIDAILRVRKTEAKTILTFKKRIPDPSDIKHQVEYESEFSDLESLKEIIANLGFEPRIVYEKRRKTWTLRSVEIVVDELPFGLFMEIEGSITGIKEAEMILGIEDLEVEYETYPRLAAQYGTRIGNKVESRFS